MSISTPFLVWSEAAGAWRTGPVDWGSLTRSIREAGRYSLADAANICRRENLGIGRPGEFAAVAVFDPLQSQAKAADAS
jgi:hypothetical protein